MAVKPAMRSRCTLKTGMDRMTEQEAYLFEKVYTRDHGQLIPFCASIEGNFTPGHMNL
ncbi:hypothetical protein [Bacillus subtilis]|uniref:hypothetical protein n=1 Tax=Bacillus subtilis TaxID=1423 RepID=UPI002E24E00C